MKTKHSSSLEKGGLASDIEGFLQRLIEDNEGVMQTQKRHPAGRKQVLPSLVLWSGVLVGLLRGFTKQSELWRLVSWNGFWTYPATNVCDQAVYNRLADSTDQTLQHLFVRVRDGLRDYLKPYAQNGLAEFATGVYAIDGSTLDKVARMLPSLREVANGDSKLLPGKLVGLFDLRLQQWCEVMHLANPNQNDKVAARALVAPLPMGSLILADLGFFAFAWFDYLTDQGMWWLSRVRDKTTYEVVHTFYTDGDTLFDGIIWLGRYRADRAAHAVRLVTFTINKRTFRYITNVLDPEVLSLHDIAVLYARRWDIELAFKTLKRHLNLHLIWSAKPTVILQQVWATFIIAQLLHAVQLEIAGRAQVDPFDVSLELLTRYVPELAREGKNPVEMILSGGRKFGFIRPSQRIRPKTPPIGTFSFSPLPDDIPLKRKHRYAERRSQQHNLANLQVTFASGDDP